MYLGGIGYQPYKIAGALSPSIKLKSLGGLGRAQVDGLGEIPVVVVKEEAAASFWEKMKGMLPFAAVMFGVSIASSLTLWGLTKLLDGRKPPSRVSARMPGH